VILSVYDAPATSMAAVRSYWSLTGDFDIQIDFTIGEGWDVPAAGHLEGASFGVDIDGQPYQITRLKSSREDVFFVWSTAGTLEGKTPSTAVSGRYRLVRKDANLALLYGLADEWRELAKATVPASNAHVFFQNGSIDASHAFTATFDDFRVNAGDTTYWQ
jgi:hypothetical protein